VRSFKEDRFITSPLEDRVYDLDTIPSPYLEGLMDEFLRDGFTPVVENNRGCPFRCAYCGASDKYYNGVVRHSLDYLANEYEYIAGKMCGLKDLPFSNTLFITDSNFGMYDIDIEISKCLRRLQNKYNWPTDIFASMGKNEKEKILQCVDILGQTLPLTASVQSTDPEILKNINRKNVSSETLISIIKKGSKDQRSYSEIILGLPGDSYERHLKSIKEMIDCHINHIYSHQLKILPNTILSTSEHRERFKTKTKFRLLITGFARVNVRKQLKTAIEHEEICVGTEYMSFKDYLKARVADFIVHSFYNNVFSLKTFEYFRKNNIFAFDYVNEVINLKKPKNIVSIIDRFVQHQKDELFDTVEDIEKFISRPDTYKRVENGEIGINTLYYYSSELKKNADEFIEIEMQAADIVGGKDLVSCAEADFVNAAKWSTDYTKAIYKVRVHEK